MRGQFIAGLLVVSLRIAREHLLEQVLVEHLVVFGVLLVGGLPLLLFEDGLVVLHLLLAVLHEVLQLLVLVDD